MQYSFFVVWRYIKKNIGRTIYSVFGIMITFILSFAIVTTGYSAWDYSYLSAREIQLWAEWIEDDTDHFGMTQEQIEQIKKLANCGEVKKLTLTHWEADDSSPEAGEKTITLALDELKPGDECSVGIGLKDVSNLEKSAQSLREQTGLEIILDGSAAEYYGQNESEWMAMYHVIVSMVGAVFSFFCIMVLRNTMMISVVERMQDYGLWRCVGMSRKQLYRQLAVEGFIMSLFAAICGVAVGYGLLQLITPWLNRLLDLEVPFTFQLYPQAVIFTTLLCVAVTLFSLLEPARQVGNISPIDAIRNNIVLQTRKGKLIEKIQYRQSKVWARLFGVSGEYAYKNMCRNRGRSLGLFFSLMFCVILIGMTQSGMDSLNATIENAYQGKSVEYLEYVEPGKKVLDMNLMKQMQSELEALDTVRKTALLFEKDEIRSYDKILQSYFEADKVNDCVHYAYDRGAVQKLEKHLLEGKADYDAMTEQNGVLLWDMSYNVQDDEFNETDIRKTEYKVGDRITELNEEARERVKKLYGGVLHSVAEQAGIPATSEELWEKITAKDSESGEYITEAEEKILSLDSVSSEEMEYSKYQEQMLTLLAEQGVKITPDEIRAVHIDPETQKSRGTETIGDILNVLEQREYDAGARTEYVIQGILSEEPINGGTVSENVFNPILLIHSQDAIRKTETISNNTDHSDQDTWGYVIQVAREPMDIENQELGEYCAKKGREIGSDLYHGNVYEDTELDVREYLSMLRTLYIVRMICILVTCCIVLVCLIQIFNTICANVVIRRKELWLYKVVGMGRRQQYRMLLLEHGVAAMAAVLLGYLAAWGLSWYLIEYLLNQDGTIHYQWSGVIMFFVSTGILLAVELVSVLGIRSVHMSH